MVIACAALKYIRSGHPLLLLLLLVVLFCSIAVSVSVSVSIMMMCRWMRVDVTLDRLVDEEACAYRRRHFE